jgi:hypothetical protein
MNISVTFTISIVAYNPYKKYQMRVEHYYSSVQVERFRIAGKDERVIELEKRLALNKQPWKIVKGDIDTSNVERSAMAIRDVQDSIDDYLEQRKSDPQNEGHVHYVRKPGKFG